MEGRSWSVMPRALYILWTCRRVLWKPGLSTFLPVSVCVCTCVWVSVSVCEYVCVCMCFCICVWLSMRVCVYLLPWTISCTTSFYFRSLCFILLSARYIRFSSYLIFFFYRIFSLLAMLILQDLNLHFCKLSKIRTQHSWKQEMTMISHPCHLIRNPVKWKISMMMMIDNYYHRYYCFYDVKLRIQLFILSLLERMTIMMKVAYTSMHW